MKKSIISLMLILVMVLTMVPTTALAAGSPTLTIVAPDGFVGDTIEVEIQLTNNPGILAFAIYMPYDNQYLSPVNYTTAAGSAYAQGSDFSGTSAGNTVNYLSDLGLGASFTMISGSNVMEGDGTLVKFQFKIVGRPDSGEIALPIYQYVTNSILKDSDGNSITPVMDISDTIVVYEGDRVDTTGVTLDSTSVSLEIGESQTLVSTVSPADATNTSVNWVSSDPTVATVDVNGTIVAVSAGTTTITATTVDGGFTASCTVTVAQEDSGSSGGSSSGGSSSSSGSSSSTDTDEDTDTDTDVDSGDGFPFIDVAESAWYRDGVEYVYYNGYMNGVSDTLFAPDSETTRAMLITVIHRMDGEELLDTEMPFVDVPDGQWYTEAVRWGAETGVVQGISDTEYAPDQALTREQMVTMLWRYSGEPMLADYPGLTTFTDVGDVGDWAMDAMLWAHQQGIITGTTDTTLAPQGTATRAQFAVMLQRYLEL